MCGMAGRAQIKYLPKALLERSKMGLGVATRPSLGKFSRSAKTFCGNPFAMPTLAVQSGQVKPLVAFVLPSLAGGGAERVMLNFICQVDRALFQPVLVTLSMEGALAGALPEDVPVVDLGRRRLRSALPSLFSALRRLRPAVVLSTFTHMNLPLLAGRPLLGVTRIIVREANLLSRSLTRMPIPAAVGFACRKLYPRADAVVASSERMRHELTSIGVSPAKIHILYNPVDKTGLREIAVPVRRRPGSGTRFVAVGRLVPQKGFDRLLDWMSEMPGDCHCTIFGEGPERSHLEEQSARLELDERVTLAGFVGNPAPWVAGADALLVPSRFEGMPNAALEALALGIPVIATPESGGLSELDNVTIAAPGTQFAAKMKAVTPQADPKLRPSILPSNFCMSESAALLNELLKRCCLDAQDAKVLFSCF